MINLSKIKDRFGLSNKPVLIFILVLVVIVLGLIFTKKDNYSYSISSQDMLKKVLETEHIITPQQFSDIYFGNDSSYRFIDLRSSPEYLEGHIKNAVHIPIHKILDEEYTAIFNQDEKINILYHYDHCHACSPWMILTQIGYKNNKILLGGYDFVKKNILDDYTPMSGRFRDETPMYDYSKIINETQGSSIGSNENPDANSSIAPVVKKEKKTKTGGGC